MTRGKGAVLQRHTDLSLLLLVIVAADSGISDSSLHTHTHTKLLGFVCLSELCSGFPLSAVHSVTVRGYEFESG